VSLIDRLRDLLQGSGPAQERPSFGELRDRTARRATPPTPAAQATNEAEEIEATDEFKLALALITEEQPFVLVMGQAGTGKTTFIRWLHTQLKGNVVVVAPTGLAALTARGQTIHSFFGFPPRPIESQDIKRRRNPAIFEEMNYLVIDEISMVSCEMLDAIDQFLRLNRRKPSKPFGGVQVIALGDLYQLPPVIKQDHARRLSEEYESFYFFGAHCLGNVVPAAVELTKPFRQKDQHFLGLLRSVREDSETEQALQELNEKCFEPEFDDASWLMVVPTRNRAEAINTARLAELPGDAKEYVGSVTGQFLGRNVDAENPNPEAAYNQLPAPFRLELKPGARVIFTKNDSGRRWVNGTMGTVRKTEATSVSVEIDENAGSLVEVTRVRWTKDKYELDRTSGKIVLKEIGAFEQLPLAPAWAITIHKVQGQTLSRLVVDLDQGAFAAGQTYVAISRCRSMEGLRLKRRIALADVRCQPEIKAFVEAIEPTLANRVLG
jgi:ATP-dependent DNA helicase PIF1